MDAQNLEKSTHVWAMYGMFDTWDAIKRYSLKHEFCIVDSLVEGKSIVLKRTPKGLAVDYERTPWESMVKRQNL